MAAPIGRGFIGEEDTQPLLPAECHSKVATHLRGLLTDAERILLEKCATWNQLRSTTDMDADTFELVLEEIRSVVGKAQLLITQKMAQFGRLIDEHEFGRDESMTPTSNDLQGFWDMINIQIEDVIRKFSELDEWRRNCWKSSDKAPLKSDRILKKALKSSPMFVTATPTPKADGSLSARLHIAEARKRLATVEGGREGLKNSDDPHSPSLSIPKKRR